VRTDPLVPAAAIWFPPEDRAEILACIDECLTTGRLTLGPLGESLEAEFAAVTGAKHAVAVSSGTSALEIVLRSVGVTDRRVLVPSNTSFATGAAVVHAGGRPVFVDVDPATMALDPEALTQAMVGDIAAVIIVHIGGVVSPAIGEIVDICRRHGVPLIEDAAHAHGSKWQGTTAGSFGVAGTFSFYPTKVLAGAEGGMIVTDDERIDAEARIYRDQGKASFSSNHHVLMGANWRLSEPAAAIIRSQVRRLDQFISARNTIARYYDEGLLAAGLSPLTVPQGGLSNYYKYVVRIGPDVDRPALKARIRSDYGVALAGEVYELPLHLQPVFASYSDGPLPGAEEVCARHICLPISAVMDTDQAERVVRAVVAELAV
jgi:perosamine synthetase